MFCGSAFADARLCDVSVRSDTVRMRYLLCCSLLLLACGDDDTGDSCRVDADCENGVCVNGACIADSDAGPRPDGNVDAETDAGADAVTSCESALFCGSPPVCCALGDECIGGACVAACESGVRCGGGCCADEQVCVTDTCQDLGDACTDSYDCDEGQFCEPTLDRCLAQFDPVTCSYDPVFEAFEPTEEWSASEFVEFPEYYRSTVMPIVADLDGDGLPEVVVAYFGGSDECRGVLRVHDGRTGEVRVSVRDIDGSQFSACPTSAVADIDNDGDAEIVVVLHDGRLAALAGDGALEWTSTDEGMPFTVGADFRAYANAAVAIGDLVPGGTPEIALGAVVLGGDGSLLWARDAAALEGDNNGYYGGLPMIADVDMDGTPELVTGRRAYENDGSELWLAATTDGYPALGNFDDDEWPEVVLVTQGQVMLIDGRSGEIEWGPEAIMGGGRGGPPTVADFDGDGAPEIGVAGATNYVVFDPSGETPVLWTRPTQDASSNATGSAVFDFEGDGSAEVVYGDECYVRAYRGTDGEELFALPNPSGTQHEYPVTADVDGDGNTEILFVANGVRDTTTFRGCEANEGWDAASRAGLFVYGDANDRWVRTRAIWNQHTYHVTNVSSAGVVPSPEVDNWTRSDLNNYRQNVQGAGVFNAPDLYVAGISVALGACPTLGVRVLVANEGNLGVPAGVVVSFYGDPAREELLGTALTSEALLPGGTTEVVLDLMPSEEAPFDFYVVVDEDAGVSTVAECDEDDNEGDITGIDCGLLI